jgi:GNAT superfamily N-acetyltransferase
VAAIIRPRAETDVCACVDALRATHDTNGYPAVWPRDPARWLTSGGGDVRAWVAAVDGAVVGHVALMPADDSAGTSDVPSLAIVRLFVVPAAGGRGIGSGLAATAVDFIRAQPSRPVLTVADSGAAAIRLYERTGWRRVGQRRADWRQADGRQPILYDYVLDAA